MSSEEMDRLIRGAGGRTPRPEAEADRPISFDGGARAPVPVEPSFDALIAAERELRLRERGELARHYDGVVADPMSPALRPTQGEHR